MPKHKTFKRLSDPKVIEPKTKIDPKTYGPKFDWSDESNLTFILTRTLIFN